MFVGFDFLFLVGVRESSVLASLLRNRLVRTISNPADPHRRATDLLPGAADSLLATPDILLCLKDILL